MTRRSVLARTRKKATRWLGDLAFGDIRKIRAEHRVDLRRMLRLIVRAIGARLSGNRERQRKIRRLMALHLLQGEAETLTYRVSGTEWTTHAHGSITKRLFAHGGYQLQEMEGVIAWLDHHGRPLAERAVLVNVGANVGSTAIPLVQKTGLSILAVEPDPGNFELLERNVRRNGLTDRIRTIHAAITSKPGEVSLVTTSDPALSEVESGGSVQGWGEGRPESVFRVPGKTLDQLIGEEGIVPESIGLVWSDTQGHEAQVIESGRSLWAAGVPCFVELWPPGLRAHGGSEAFVRAVKESFDRLIERTPLRDVGTAAEPRSIDAIEDVLKELEPSDHSDALLLPGNFRQS